MTMSKLDGIFWMQVVVICLLTANAILFLMILNLLRRAVL